MLPRNLGQGERAPPSIAWAAATEARGRRRAIGTDTSNRSTIPPVGAPQKLGDVGDAVPVAVHAIGLRLRQGRGKRPGVAADHAARAGAARLMLVVGHFHALELFALQLDGDDVGPRDQADGRRHREKSRLSHRGRLLDVLDVQPQSDTRFVSDVLAVHTPATFRLVGFAHESAASLVGKPHRVLPVLLHCEPHSGSAIRAHRKPIWAPVAAEWVWYAAPCTPMACSDSEAPRPNSQDFVAVIGGPPGSRSS